MLDILHNSDYYEKDYVTKIKTGHLLTMAFLCLISSNNAFAREHAAAEVNDTLLVATVRYLSEELGERSFRSTATLNKAADYIENAFRSYGYDVRRQAFVYDGRTYYNVIAEAKGTNPDKKGCIIVGAHYDTVIGTPGADDNASGVAGLLEMARLTALQPAERTIRFVAFCLEEPPVFGTDHMGSYAYAKSVKDEGMPVYGMISLEMIGYFCEEKGCQEYPLSALGWFMPDTGDYIAFVGDLSSRSFTKKVKKAFMNNSKLPVESLNTFSSITGVDFSDHRNFWKFGYKAFMITDTSFYRNPDYHESNDTWEKLDYKKMSALVSGLRQALMEI